MNPRNQAAAPRGIVAASAIEAFRLLMTRRLFRTLRLTRIGMGAVVFLALIGAAAMNTGTNLLYLMLATILSFLAMAVSLCKLNLAALQPRRCLPSEIHAGEPVLYEIELANRKRRVATYGVACEETNEAVEGGRVAVFFMAVLPGKALRQGTSVVFPRRGWARLDELAIVTCFPFGFVEATSRKSVPERILVFPKLVPVEPLLRQSRLDLGERASRARGQGTSLHAIRDYTAGDPARSIHWKLSAKGETLKVRENEREEARRIRILLDHRLPPSATERERDELERAISAAASLADHFIKRGHETALWCPAGAVEGGQGDRHLRRILRLLAEAPAEAFASTASPPQAAPGMFTDVWATPAGEPATTASVGTTV